MKSFDYNTYLSPFTWRYGSAEMKTIWSEIHKRKLWRKIWVELARAQQKQGLITKEELDDLINHKDNIDIEKAHEIEKEIHHDLMAEIKTYASQATIGGGKIHLGATSMDIEDNADTLRIKESLEIVEENLKQLIAIFTQKIETYKKTPCMGYTHLQPAEPTTLGYRFSLYAQDLLFDYKSLAFVKTMLKGKGMKGAVGTGASYFSLLNSPRHSGLSKISSTNSGQVDSGVANAPQNDETYNKVKQMEQDVMQALGIDAVTITSQTSPRKLELFVSQFLSSVAQSLHKFAFDLRIMQSPGFGEWQEPFGKKQVGSSAMPFKRNPWKAEQICSLARVVFHAAETARDNASLMLLERTLDDSANRRVYIPEMFLAIDEMITSATKIIDGIVINEQQIKKNLATYGPFSATESILMTAVKNGANRQEIHEVLRENALKAYEAIQQTGINPLEELLLQDKRLTQYVEKETMQTLFDPKKHIGTAPFQCEKLLQELQPIVKA